MSLSETMYWLAENYWIGIGVISGIVIVCYVCLSLAVLFSARKKGIDVAVCAMIPVWNLKYAYQASRVGKPPRVKRVKKHIKPSEEPVQPSSFE